MKRPVIGLALLSSIAAFLVIVGGGLVLLLVPSSGERGAGALIALSGSIAFAAALLLTLGWGRVPGTAESRAGALTCALLAALPLAALSAIALRFSGLPIGSTLPLVDWSVFGVGLVFTLGALSMMATGYWRMQDAMAMRRQPEREEAEALVAAAAAQLEAMAKKPEAASAAKNDVAEPDQAATEPSKTPPPEREWVAASDDDIRVTPVELPSIGQFRRRQSQPGT